MQHSLVVPLATSICSQRWLFDRRKLIWLVAPSSSERLHLAMYTLTVNMLFNYELPQSDSASCRYDLIRRLGLVC
jgi:hypothetical protein